MGALSSGVQGESIGRTEGWRINNPEHVDRRPMHTSVDVMEPSRSEPSQLSTFRPTRDLNVYELSAGEANFATGLQNETSVLSIHQEETLAHPGTSDPTVLKWSASILSVTLSASKVAHHVFDLRSAPIPILRCASSDVHADSNISSLPPRLYVEGLGRVYRIFDGVFEPSRWQRSSTDVIRPGVSLVTHSTRDVLPFVLPESWSIALSAAEMPPSSADPIPLLVYVVKGPKKSGKSICSDALEQASGEISGRCIS
ncbi:uncharacterized protein F5147DRAFT_693255 [Suillus discolor]|uniref:Uncharacterized protein n=1 Tax=Suillus discolor TaxID=1912936 RepID=A0A9P7F8M7_9AGAM|nr:uncharacterized protein F5147DRAFT_693255 [Suillus discolor]KAG2109409.1 hypothetical protein F5147DRAFT_693255 [Suillus discolor]